MCPKCFRGFNKVIFLGVMGYGLRYRIWKIIGKESRPKSETIISLRSYCIARRASLWAVAVIYPHKVTMIIFMIKFDKFLTTIGELANGARRTIRRSFCKYQGM
jgi:hypothetical protein